MLCFYPKMHQLGNKLFPRLPTSMKKGTAEKETGKEGEDRVCERTKEMGMNGG